MNSLKEQVDQFVKKWTSLLNEEEVRTDLKQLLKIAFTEKAKKCTETYINATAINRVEHSRLIQELIRTSPDPDTGL